MERLTETGQEKRPRRKASDKAAAAIVLAFVMTLVGQLLGMSLQFFPPLYSTPMTLTAFFYLQFIGVWIVVLLYLRFTKKNRPILKCLWKNLPGNTPSHFLLGAVIGLGLNGVCILIAWLHGDIHLYFDTFQPIGLLYTLLTVFIQASSEELVSRAFLYQRLMRRYGKPAVAIIGNSMLFAFLHVFNSGATPLPIANVFLMGVLFSLPVYYLDSIWFSMALHTGWNYCQSILFGLPNSGYVLPFSLFKLDAATAANSFAYDIGFGIEGSVAACVATIIAIAAFILWGRKNALKPTDIWTETEAEYV